MLPEGFYRQRQTASTRPHDTVWLCLDKKVVRYVSQNIHGRWFAITDRHLVPSQWKQAFCRDPEQGRSWLERWAMRDQARLRADPTGRFVAEDYAKRHPATTVKEHNPPPKKSSK
jgi:hypothetical protein